MVTVFRRGQLAAHTAGFSGRHEFVCKNTVNLARALLNALRVFAQSFINDVEGFDLKRRKRINLLDGVEGQ